jgi:hypothetical protein
MMLCVAEQLNAPASRLGIITWLVMLLFVAVLLLLAAMIVEEESCLLLRDSRFARNEELEVVEVVESFEVLLMRCAAK